MVSEPTFDGSVAHRHIDADEHDDIYLVGDVHGCLAELRALLARLDVGDDDLVVFVGDLVRKGPDSLGVLDLVRRSPNMTSVRGNNEEKLLRGDAVIQSFGPAEREYVASLPVAISFDDALVVHGGVDPQRPLDEHSVDDLQNMRSLAGGSYERPFWFEEHDGPRQVFFGHTVLERPVDREWAVGLDTGCVYGGELTAYDYHAEELVVEPAERTVEERSDDSIVSPRSSSP